jgi:alpha-tubulin suppressor-like RCC1 family protein
MIGAAHLMMRQAGVSQPKGLFGWGANESGQLGLGNRTNLNSPVQVGALTDWSADNSKLSGGYVEVSFFIKTNGTLWSCGRNDVGQLGTGNIIDYSSPVQVGSDTNWSQIAAGANGDPYEEGTRDAVGAIKTTGSLWTWGCGDYGGIPLPAMLGRGAVSGNFSSPVQVGTLLDWAKIATTFEAMGAIKTDGSLWTWGMNWSGELGLGDRTSRSSPVQVGSLLDWVQLKGFQHPWSGGFLGIKNNKTLWAWGANDYGQLGLGDRTSRSSPVQVGSATDWEQVSTGELFALAIRTGGTLWAWGYNLDGELGLGDTTNRSSPVQVGSATDWSKVYTVGYVSLAIKTDGTLWSWGDFSGAQGQGDNVKRSSPVQVGSGTNWAGLSINGRNSVVGVRT